MLLNIREKLGKREGCWPEIKWMRTNACLSWRIKRDLKEMQTKSWKE